MCGPRFAFQTKGCQGNLQGGWQWPAPWTSKVCLNCSGRSLVSWSVLVFPPEKVLPAAGTLCKLTLTPSGQPCHRTHTGCHSQTAPRFPRSQGPRHHWLYLTIKTNFGSHKSQPSEISQLPVSQFNSLEAKPTVFPRFHSTPLRLLLNFPLNFLFPHTILFQSQSWKQFDSFWGSPPPRRLFPALVLSQRF